MCVYIYINRKYKHGGLGPRLTLQAEMVAQARHYSRTVPGTILVGPGRVWAVLFRVVPGLTPRVSAK